MLHNSAQCQCMHSGTLFKVFLEFVNKPGSFITMGEVCLAKRVLKHRGPSGDGFPCTSRDLDASI